MVVVMRREATEADVEAVAERVRAAGGEAFVSRGAVHTIVGLVGDTERFQAFDVREDRHFTWIVGMQMTLMLAVIGAMVGAYYR